MAAKKLKSIELEPSAIISGIGGGFIGAATFSTVKFIGFFKKAYNFTKQGRKLQALSELGKAAIVFASAPVSIPISTGYGIFMGIHRGYSNSDSFAHTKEILKEDFQEGKSKKIKLQSHTENSYAADLVSSFKGIINISKPSAKRHSASTYTSLATHFNKGISEISSRLEKSKNRLTTQSFYIKIDKKPNTEVSKSFRDFFKFSLPKNIFSSSNNSSSNNSPSNEPQNNNKNWFGYILKL